MKKTSILISVLFSSFLLASCSGSVTVDFSTVLAAPSNLTATASDGAVNLSWNSVAGATSYRVHQAEQRFGGDVANYGNLVGYKSMFVAGTSKEITELTNGVTYYFVVTALKDGQESLASNVVIGSPDLLILLAPTNLTVTASSSGTVSLSWNSVAEATYKVYQSTGSIGGDLSSYSSNNASINSIDITGLTNGVSYYFVVTALRDDEESLASNEVSGFPDFPQPSTPTNLRATPSSGTINLYWDSVAGASYQVYQSTGTIISDDLSIYSSYNVRESFIEIPGLANGTTYYFVVIAVIADKKSGVSDEVSGLPEENLIAPPTNLEVSASSGTVTLNWNSVAEATYKVHQSTSSFVTDVADYKNLPGYSSIHVTATSTDITDLMNGVSYYFVVTAIKDGKESGASNEVIGRPDFPIPATPTGLVVTNVSSGTVDLSWDSVAGASYKVYQAIGSIIADNLSGYQSYETITNSTEITGLTNGETYYFVVTAIKDGKESGASNEVIGNPDFPIPTAPTNLRATPSSGTVNLSWTGSDGATYRVYQATGSIGDNLSGHISYDVTETSTKITGLTNGETYYFVVTALANSKESPASNEVSGLPDFSIPPAPTSLTVTGESSGTVNLSWTGSDGATYRVHQAASSFDGVADYETLEGYISHNVSTSSIEIAELMNGTRYYFVVTALANGKVSPASEWISGLPDFPIPSAPTSLTVTSASSGTVNLSWDSVAGASYTVYRLNRSIGSIGDDLSNSQPYETTRNSIAITGLTNNTRYYFVVTALVNGKVSPASNEVNGLPEFPLPSTPTNLTASASSGTVNLSWTGSEGVHYYKVYQSTATIIADDLSSYSSRNVTASTIEITGLTNNTTYYFVVTAVIDDKESGASDEISGLPEFPQPSTPTNLRATPSSGTVNLSWIGSAGVHYYKVYQSTGTIIAADLSSYTSYNVTITSTEIRGLANGTTYYFVVRAVIGDKESGISDEVSVLPEENLIAPPTNLEVTDSSGAVSLNWTGREGATYKVHQAEGTFGIVAVADYTSLAGYSSAHVTETSTKITGLINGARYYFVVTALVGSKESGASNEVIGNPDFPIPSTPTNLEVTDSSGTVNLSWDSVAGASYKVYQSTASIANDLSAYISYDVTETSTKITGLTNGTLYYFVVTALENGKESPASDEVIGLPDFPIPSSPTGLVVTSASSGTVNLNWNSVAGATYKVYRSTASIANDLSGSIFRDATTNSIEISGLRNGTSYYFVVTALANGKESPVSKEVDGLPDFLRPATPTGLVVTSVSSGTVNLRWNSVAGVSYTVYQSTGSIGDDLSSYSSYNLTARSIRIPELINGVTYYFVVTALANGKESLASDEVIGLPDFPIPSTPTGLMVTGVSSGTVNLSWDSVAGATSYKVYQSSVSIGDDLAGYTSAHVTTTSTEITELRNGTAYYFVVTALANGKESAVSNVVDGRPDFPIPSTPTGLEVTGVSSGTVNLSWNSVVGATYRVHRAARSSFDGVADYGNLESYSSIHVTVTSIEITGLTNGVPYYFVVTALANGKESAISNVVDERPDFPIPSTPTGLVVTSVSSGTVNLNWDSVIGATSYKVYQSTVTPFNNDLSSYQSYETTIRSREITGLKNGTSYYFVVTALANGKESLASDEVDGFPEFSIPSTPTTLIASVSSGTVNLSWDRIAGATYRVHQAEDSFDDVTDYETLAGYTSHNVSTSTIEITNLTNNTRYYFVVTALANGKESPASEWVSALPEFPRPSSPTNLMVTSVSSGTVNLSWDSVAGASYTVYRSRGPIGDDLSTSQPYDTTRNSTAITGLMNNTSYYFVVTALANGKVSVASNEVIGLPEFPVPSTPTNLTASASSGTVNLSWTGSEGVHSYKVYQSTGTIIADDLSSYSSYNVTANTKEITGLTNNTTYYFVVTAVIGDKESPASDEISGLPEFPQPSTPTNLSATPSSGTVNLNWTASAGAHYYKVYQSTGTIIADDLSSYTSYNVTVSSKEITGLTNYRTYYFVIVAVIGDKESGISDEVSGFPEEDLIAPPTNLMVTDSSGAVSLNWTGREGATYTVHRAEETFGIIAVADYGALKRYSSTNVTASSKEITGLMNGESYFFVVTARLGSKESGASNEVIGNPDFPIPSTPTNLEVTASSGTVNLSWDSVVGASYKVYQSTTSIANDLSAHISYDVTEISTKITGLRNGTRYYFVVTALANGKESPASDEVTGNPDFPIPATPTGLVVTSVGSGTVDLSWNSVAGATYKVYQLSAPIGDDLSNSIVRPAMTNSIEITRLTNNRIYYFVVTALVNGKESPVSNEVEGIPDSPIPSTPTGLMVTGVDNGTVNLRWSSVVGATYKVYQSTGTIIADDLSSYTSYNVTARSKSITGLTNGTRYYFVVTALKNGKESPASDEVEARPDFPILSTPTGLMVTSVSSGIVNLSWNSVAGATSYKVYRSMTAINGDVALSLETVATTSSIAITNLTNGTRYYFVVTALANGKESGISNEVDEVPDFPIPLRPEGLVAFASSGTVNLGWGSVAGATYTVHQAESSFDNIAVANYGDLVGYTSAHVTATSKEITNLENGTRYYFVVTALANGKESPASDEVSELPDFPLPSAPTNLMVTNASGTVNLGWNGVAGATYRVHQAESSFADVAVADYGILVGYQSYETSASSREISNLTNGMSYYFVVTALANGKESLASNEVDGIPDFPIPPKPTNLTVTRISSGTMYLTWSGSDGVTYKVHQSTETFASMVPLNYGILSGYQSTEVNTNSIEITGLMTNGTTYYFVVTALANGKESAASNEISETPIAPRPLNDTGITWAGNYDDSGNFPFEHSNQSGTNCSPTGFAEGTEQDCHQGRDAAWVAGTLTKIGGGQAGFDYSKLSSVGTVLSIQNSTWSDSGSESSGTRWSCVRDNVTGAVWEVKVKDINSIHHTSNSYTYNGWAALVDGTNEENLCGYNDWRVPTITEMHSLMNLGGANPAYDISYFPNGGAAGHEFWTSTRYTRRSQDAWMIVFAHHAGIQEQNYTETENVRLIRSSFTAINSWPNSRYTDHRNGTVTDKATGLMWAKCTLGRALDNNDCTREHNAGTMTWKKALEEVSSATFTLAGYTDWRVPNKHELITLMAYDRNVPINQNLFPNPGPNSYLTSSPISQTETEVGPNSNLTLDQQVWGFLYFAGGTDNIEDHVFWRNRHAYVHIVRDSQ